MVFRPSFRPRRRFSFRLRLIRFSRKHEPESRRFGASGFPKFTNQVQHFLYKVLQWDNAMNSSLEDSVRYVPGLYAHRGAGNFINSWGYV